jgi:ATP-dependent Clp endopeptidase proteolytic subunit ClpP
MPVIDTDNGQMDVISRLLKDRILLLGQGVDDEVANVLVAQLLYLANEDPEKDITLYINSPVRIRDSESNSIHPRYRP